ncbi:AAA domain-containing protein [Stieleria varia]|uniref:ATP-dependent RecD-like DNA helicase n=1 Tax=Stieleria varia TaxID=2528005 RepID=A0A5C6B953_9BACT|nr:AAA domain-containing protein [Stieleria varia]TWU08172.1 ATP-dependent RecD-like DNA helicase [Stieleria varia]
MLNTQPGDADRDPDDVAADAIAPVRFPSQWDLPPGNPQQLTEAAKAVRMEFRDCSKWKRLRCEKVSVVAERDRGVVYVVKVAGSVDFEWSCEGATAFCPASLDDDARFSDLSYEEADYQDGVIWSGEILEFDETQDCLFVCMDEPTMSPRVGSFFVKPFEFLAALDSVYNGNEFEQVREVLPARLNATKGEIHPRLPNNDDVGLPEMVSWWRHSWSILWGPPGTGKTYTTGQQIARIVSDPSERILIVSTTNRATDAVALSIGVAAKAVCPERLADESMIRIGKGAALDAFEKQGLGAMLRSTESEAMLQMAMLSQRLQQSDSLEEKAFTRKQLAELQAASTDRSKMLFTDESKCVVVATAFKAMNQLKQPTIREMIQDGEAPFTTIMIDEAGLISRATVAALSLLASRRVVLVGDSKQLAPISRISRILPTRHQTWLASSGLSHLDRITETPSAVHVLSQQRRMNPDVCRVVSEYQYDGFLTTADDRAQRPSRAPEFLADYSRTIWYVLDGETDDLAAIRASRGPGNKSWVREITPSILKKLFTDPQTRNAEGMFISPFKAQAEHVADLLSQWEISSWESSTVHSQQGSEADVVVFDTVNAGSYNWPFEEWKRLVNVALSRAKEAVIVIASRHEMDEPYLRPLLNRLRPGILVDSNGTLQWQQPDARRLPAHQVAERTTEYHRDSDPRSGDRHGRGETMGQQIASRQDMKPVLSREQQKLVQMPIDGKPRLVRGVAGSGKSVVLATWLAKTALRFQSDPDAHIWAVYANRSLHKLLRESVESAWQQIREGELFSQADFPWQRVSLIHVRDVLAGLLPSVELSMDAFEFDYDSAAAAFLDRVDMEELLPRCTALFIDEAQDMGPATLRLLLSLVEKSIPSEPSSRSAHIFYDNAQNLYGTKTPNWSEFGLDLRGRSTIMRESFRSTTPIMELAVNLFHTVADPGEQKDQHELVSLGLLHRVTRDGVPWMEVRFSQVDGPCPVYHAFDHRQAEINAIAGHLQYLVEQEEILPQDICLIFNGKGQQALETQLAPKLAEHGIELSIQKHRAFERRPNTLVATTANSFKGYESEVVVIPCVDQFIATGGKILASSLYVAMTRARSLLAIYGVSDGSTASSRLHQAITQCVQIVANDRE